MTMAGGILSQSSPVSLAACCRSGSQTQTQHHSGELFQTEPSLHFTRGRNLGKRGLFHFCLAWSSAILRLTNQTYLLFSYSRILYPWLKPHLRKLYWRHNTAIRHQSPWFPSVGQAVPSLLLLRSNTGCVCLFFQPACLQDPSNSSPNKRIIVILCPVYSFKQLYFTF